MPTCSASSLKSPSLNSCLRDVYSLSGRNKRICRNLQRQRLTSTAAALAPKPQPSSPSQPQHNDLATPSHTLRTPLTTIHHTSAFIRRVLPPRSRQDVKEAESLEFWEDMLNKASDELSAPKAARGVARIAGAWPLVLVHH